MQGSASILGVKKMNPPLTARTHLGGRLTYGPTKLTGTKGFVNLVNMNDSSSIDRTMSIQWPQCFFNLWSSCFSSPNQHRSCRMLPPPVAGSAAAQASPPHCTPIAGLAIPLLTHTCYYSLATADEPVNPRTVVLPSVWETKTTAESSLPPCRSLPRPRHRPPPWCSRRGVVSVVNDRHASEVDCTWRG